MIKNREYNPLQHWFETPIGYYPHNRSYGNNLHILLFKNSESMQLLLNDILDKIYEDLGEDIFNTIDEIFTAETDKEDVKLVIVRYNSDEYAFGEIK